MKIVRTVLGLLIIAGLAAGGWVLAFRLDKIRRVVPEEDVHAEPEVQVHVGKIERRTLHRYVEGFGIVEPEPAQKGAPPAGARVSSPVQGVVAEVLCWEGQNVAKDAPLLRLDDRTTRAAEDKARAALATAQKSLARLKSTPRPEQIEMASIAVETGRASLEYSQKKLARQKKLAESDLSSEKLLQDAELETAKARSDLATAEKQLALLKSSPTPQELAEAQGKVTEAQKDLDAARALRSLQTLSAPIAGTILRVNVRPGEAVDLSTVLAEIGALDRLVVTAQVSAGEAKSLKTGMRAEIITPSAAEPREGSVTWVSLDIDPQADTLNLRVTPKDKAGWRSGMSARVRVIVLERNEVMAVPKESIIEDSQTHRTYVATVNEETAIPQSVHVLLKDGDWVQVEGKTIKPDMTIVTLGAYALPNDPHGTKIHVIDPSQDQETPAVGEKDVERPELTLQVQLGKVERKTLRRYVEGTGVVEPEPAAKDRGPAGSRVAPFTPGLVAEVLCFEGQRVEKGQILFRLNERSARADEDKAQASLDSARASLARLKSMPRLEQLEMARLSIEASRAALEYSEKKLARLEKLAADGDTPERVVEDARIEVVRAKGDLSTAEKQLSLLKSSPTPEESAEAEARVKEAESDLEAARTRRSLLSIAAPLSGTVLRVNVKPGEAVDVTAVMTEIVDLGRLVATVVVPAGQADSLKPGMAVHLLSSSDPVPHDGIISVVGWDADPKKDSVTVKASVPASVGLRPGNYVSARIVVESHPDILAVPREAVVESRASHSALVFVAEGGCAFPRSVNLGFREGNWVEVSGKDVKDDQLVVTVGSGYLSKDARGTRIRGLLDLEMIHKPYPYLKLLHTIPLEGVEGKIDHLCVDPEGKFLFICATESGAVPIIDLAKRQEVDRIQGLVEPQGVFVIPGSNRLVVSCGGGASVKFYSLDPLKLLGEISNMSDADNVRYDAAVRRLYVGYEKGSLAIIDPDSMQKIADVKLPAHPEAFEFESSGKRIWLNLPNANKVAVIDREKARLITTWEMKPDSVNNFPMAQDADNHRVFIGCRTPPRILVLDSESGAPVAEIECSADMDDLFYDPATKRIFALCGGSGGCIDIFSHENADSLARAGRVPTAALSRTGILDPRRQRLYLAIRRSPGQDAEVRVYENIP